ncbi:MAG TPA: HD domain-containing protein [Candidatus Limnocylindrales bacterium]|nr:HD domain-containing protein [Candidatus Limnocylindrales bacterium]
MAAPDRIEAASLLLSLSPPRWGIRHARAVAETAAWLARAVDARSGCDRTAVEGAGLLHDADKALPADHPVRRLPHGEGSAAWLADRGHPELGPLVANHPAPCLLAEGFERWLTESSIEAAIVAYADKRAGQRLEPMSARFAGWARRHGDDGWPRSVGDLAWSRAVRLEARVCEAAGCEPGHVRRLAWTGDALRAAVQRQAAA